MALGRHLTERFLVAFQQTLQHILDVLQQVKAIRDLNGLRGASPRALGVVRRPIPRDDFD